MADNYIGVNGLVVQTLEEIKTDLETKFKAIYGDNINLEQNSPDGQLINILAQEKKDILDLLVQFYNNIDVDAVYGLPQEILYKLNGLAINAYTYSYVYVNVTVTEDVTLQGLDDNINNADGTGYTVRDTNGNRYILAATTDLTANTTTLLNFRAAELGSVTSLANTVIIMETVVKGVASVNNPANNYITGNTGETTAQFRQRRNKALSVASQGFTDSIQSQLLALPDVTQAKVYDNKTDIAVNEIPPHSVWVVVQGGTPQEIGQIIYANLPPGIPMKGEQSALINKPNGDMELFYYDLPTAVNLYVRATIKNFTQIALDTENIKTTLAATNYNIQEMVKTSDLTLIMQNALGETGTPYNVEISADGNTWVEYLTPTGLDEFFVIATDNITLTVE